jgi:hypothetical protein
MKLSGKELNEFGCPPKLIKFFVNKEFESKSALRNAINNFSQDNRTDEEKLLIKQLENPDCIFQWLLAFGRDWSIDSLWDKSKSQLKRLLLERAILMNGKTPIGNEEMIFPVTELVFFHKSKHKVTLY